MQSRLEEKKQKMELLSKAPGQEKPRQREERGTRGTHSKDRLYFG
jgi:hypothetical protein